MIDFSFKIYKLKLRQFLIINEAILPPATLLTCAKTLMSWDSVSLCTPTV